MFFLMSLPAHGSKELSRCFGYFSTLAEAHNAVARNQFDMHECLYVHLVIEEIGDGIHADAHEMGWYCWNFDKNAWQPCERPQELKWRAHFAF